MSTQAVGECYKSLFVELLIDSLRRHLEDSQEPSFVSEDEERIVEYYQKDLAQRGVSEHTSRRDCVGLFEKRVRDLADGNDYEWSRLRDLMREAEILPSEKRALALKLLKRVFGRKKPVLDAV